MASQQFPHVIFYATRGRTLRMHSENLTITDEEVNWKRPSETLKLKEDGAQFQY